MLYREIVAVCSQIHTKHIHTLCGHNGKLLNVQLVVYKVITAALGGSNFRNNSYSIHTNKYM